MNACLFLSFQLHGHKKISVLDGGLKKWMNDGYEVTSEVPKIEVGHLLFCFFCKTTHQVIHQGFL